MATIYAVTRDSLPLMESQDRLYFATRRDAIAYGDQHDLPAWAMHAGAQTESQARAAIVGIIDPRGSFPWWAPGQWVVEPMNHVAAAMAAEACAAALAAARDAHAASVAVGLAFDVARDEKDAQ